MVTARHLECLSAATIGLLLLSMLWTIVTPSEGTYALTRYAAVPEVRIDVRHRSILATNRNVFASVRARSSPNTHQPLPQYLPRRDEGSGDGIIAERSFWLQCSVTSLIGLLEQASTSPEATINGPGSL
jgi:hypothetical protein